MSDERDDRFTPGPWDVYVTAGMYSIQHLHADKRVEDIAHGIADEHNARLIAAAPQMYEALETAAELLDAHHGCQCQRCTTAVNNARAGRSAGWGRDG